MTTLESRPPTYPPGQPGSPDADVLTVQAPAQPADPDAAFSQRLATVEAAKAPALQRSTRASC